LRIWVLHYTCVEIVGDLGELVVIDINRKWLKNQKRSITSLRPANIELTFGNARETTVYINCVDVVFFDIMLYCLEDPERVLTNAKHMPKPTGPLVNLDWKKKFIPLLSTIFH
jgi:ubiquinone/menaquinone biosynthesis C-methylase UbiE